MIRLRELRGKKSRQQIANAIKLPLNTYTNYETGKREAKYETLILLANYFNVSIDYLLGRTDFKQLDLSNNPEDIPPTTNELLSQLGITDEKLESMSDEEFEFFKKTISAIIDGLAKK